MAELVLPLRLAAARHISATLGPLQVRRQTRDHDRHRRWGKDDVALHSALRRACSGRQLLAPAARIRAGQQGDLDRSQPAHRHAPHRRGVPARAARQDRRTGDVYPVQERQHLAGDRLRQLQSLVGTPPAGIVFSEWAQSHPGAWAYLAPILVENDGWALFITTPRAATTPTACTRWAATIRLGSPTCRRWTIAGR